MFYESEVVSAVSCGVVWWGADTKVVLAGAMAEKKKQTKQKKNRCKKAGSAVGLSWNTVLENEHEDWTPFEIIHPTRLLWCSHGAQLASHIQIAQWFMPRCTSWWGACQRCLYELPWTVFRFVSAVRILAAFSCTVENTYISIYDILGILWSGTKHEHQSYKFLSVVLSGSCS